jgi:hypothetical protein
VEIGLLRLAPAMRVWLKSSTAVTRIPTLYISLSLKHLLTLYSLKEDPEYFDFNYAMLKKFHGLLCNLFVNNFAISIVKYP